MKIPRFYMTDQYGLILETPIPLQPSQREACRIFAFKEYKRRLTGLPSGERRDALVRVLDALKANKFIERAIPEFDSSKEVTLHG